MKVAFFTDGLDTPSGRFRVEQLLPHFREHGIECVRYFGYGSAYNRIAPTRLGVPYKVLSRGKRALLQLLPHGADVVFLQRTALPHTAFPERLGALMGQRIVFDFDDVLHLGPNGEPSALRRRAFQHAVDASAHVIAGNEYLRQLAGCPEKSTVIPTVVDTDLVVPDPRRVHDEVIIGWMGTASNFPSLAVAIPGIRKLLDAYPRARFRIVSNAEFRGARALPRVEQLPWSRETELSLLQSFDVGLMPLLDNEITRGKCAFKLIQYMAVGCPAVGSHVGANIPLLRDSRAGALVPVGGDWFATLVPFVEDPALRRAAGDAARKRAVAEYSVRSVVDRYVRLFRALA